MLELTKDPEVFETPRLKKDAELSHLAGDYFPGTPAEWTNLSIDEREAHIIEMSRGRCPIFGVPRLGEYLKVVRIANKELGPAEMIDSPWMYMAVLWSDDESRNACLLVGEQPDTGKWRIGHWDPLDEKEGLELVDVERRHVSHASLDYYTRTSSTQAQAASEWHDKTCAAWSSLQKAMFEFTLYFAGAKDNVENLGYEKPKDWLSAVGIKFSPVSKLMKLLDHPSSISELWTGELGISPFVLLDFISKVPEDEFNHWLPILKEKAAYRPILGGDTQSDIDGLLDDLALEFPKDTKPKHFLVFPGAVQYTEFEVAEKLTQDQEGLQVTVVEGKLSWKGKMQGEKLGLPFDQ